MSHPFFWPRTYYFYPIGNTSAVCLTRDLPREEHADVLLLGCGDPRHILYTMYSEADASPRRVDFTCVDFEPGVLARNILLFSLIIDKIPIASMWNIFYHMYLDVGSHSTLIDQCKKLVNLSESSRKWRASPYAALLRMSTELTLSEVRRHWSLYAAMPELHSSRQKAIREAFGLAFKGLGTTHPLTTARSAGPTVHKAAQMAMNQATNYCKTGTTFTQSQDVSEANLLNPTFAYSLVGEGCAVHYATDPLTTFHFAAVFGNARESVGMGDMVREARAQFSSWCVSFQRATSNDATAPGIRFFLAEAIAACHAFRSFSATGALNSGIPVSQFRSQFIHLDSEEFIAGGAPTSFNVVETSNLVDHIGLLNILIAAAPIMSSSPFSVLYTESLLFHGEDGTKEFTELLYADVGTLGLLLDLCPVDYLSGFSTRSNTHEIILYQLVTKKDPVMKRTQFHQVTTWKSPACCDNVLALKDGHPQLPPVFDARQLGTLLFDIYQAMFEQEDALTFFRQNQQNLLRAFSSSNIIHYMRESFVLLLKLVRERLRVPEEVWTQVMDRFIDLESETNQLMPMNTVNRNDFYAHLYRQRVYTVDYYKRMERMGCTAMRIGRFAEWDVVPPVVRVILVVPRVKIREFEDTLDQTRVRTPPLQCDTKGSWSHNIFTAVHVTYGRVISVGTRSSPRVRIEEDPEGRDGSFDLLASFVLPAFLLAEIEPPHKISVRLTARDTSATIPLQMKMGLDLLIYGASLMDEERVHVLPEPQISTVATFDSPAARYVPPNTTLQVQLGRQRAVSVELDEQCELVSSVTARIDIENTDVIRDFGAGAMPDSEQASPCTMRLSVAGHVQIIVFPFPIIGTQKKLRLARKSRYIEVVVPPAGPFLKPDGMKLNPFPVTGHGKVFSPWNMHRLALDRLTVLDLKGSELKKWLEPHVGSMLSARERKMSKEHKKDTLVCVKENIGTIFVQFASIQGGKPRNAFSLVDEATSNCDTVFLLSGLRYDLPSHTVVCDGYVLPLTHDFMPEIEKPFSRLVHSGSMCRVRVSEGEMKAWKQLLPAFVERCRTWEHADSCEYLARQEIPLTREMEADPLCSCGRGKDVDELMKVPEWRVYAPHVTRMALSPLFAVSYLETIGRDPAAHKCSVCRGKGKPKLKACSACQKVRYCTSECQRKDWPRHKPECKS